MYSVSDIISRSLKLAWQHKILWVLALMIGVGSFNSSGNYTGGGSSGDTYKVPQNEERFDSKLDKQIQSPTSLISSVLGTLDSRIAPSQFVAPSSEDLPFPIEEGAPPPYEYTNSFENEFMVDPIAPSPPPPFPHNITPILEVLQFIGIGNIVLVVFSFLVLIGFSVFMGIFIQSWAYGAFLGGINSAIRGETYNLRDLGNFGRKSTKEFVKYRLLFALLGLLLFVVLIGFGAYALITEQYVFIVFAFFLILPLLLGLFILLLVDRFAVRFIALKGLTYVNALKSGTKMLLNNVGKFLVLAIANCFVATFIAIAAIVGLVALGASLFIPGTLLFDVDNMSTALMALLILLGVPLVFILIALFTALTAYLSTYKGFTWSMFFNFGSDEPNYKIKDNQ